MKMLAKKLKFYNLKVTSQRLAIFNMLSNTDKHPSAETIYRALITDNPAMSLATVYKTLDTLKRTKLIQEINVGEDSFRYDANNMPHAHMVCTTCHEVFDAPHCEAVDQLKREFSERTDFEMLHEQIFFYGTCRDCLGNA